MEKLKDKKMSIEKKIVVAEAILVFGALIYLFASSSPTAVSPIAGQVVSDPNFLFEIEDGDKIIISNDKEFSNAMTLEEGSDIILPPGTYYWKVRNWLRESEIKTFTIQSHVGLNLREGEDKNLLENSGNVDVDVEKDNQGITTNIKIGAGESEEVETDDSSYTGEQDG